MKSRSESLIKNTTVLTFGMMCTKGLMFIMTPLFTKWLSAEDYGCFDLMVTYISLLVPLFTLSVGEAVFRKILDESDELRKKAIAYLALVISIMGSGVAGFCILFFAFFWKENSEVLFCFWFFFCGEVFFSLCTYLLRGQKKMNAYSLGNIVYVVGLSVFAPVFVLIFKLGLRGIILGYFWGDVISIITMVLIGDLGKYIKKTTIERRIVKEILDYSLPMIPNAISWWIINVSDRMLISLVLGVAMNAIYAISNKVPALCTTFFSVFHLSWQQNAAETMSDEDRDTYYSDVMNNMFCIVSSICIVVIASNYWFFKLLFSDYYFEGVYQSPILVLAIIFSMLSQFIGGIYVAQMKSKKNGFTTTIAATMNIVVNIVLIKKIGLYAASISTMLAYISLFMVRYIDIKRTVNLKFYRKSIGIFACVLAEITVSYIHTWVIQLLLVAFGTIFFCIINWGFIKKYLMRITEKSI